MQKVTVSGILQLLLPKLCYFFSPKIVQFQNGSNKVANEFRVVQFWSEIILARTYDFRRNSIQATISAV